MTSKERHEVRYQRRAARRRAKREQVCSLYDNYDNVFTISNLYQSYLQSRKNVGWKDSVQQYKANAIVNIHNTYKTMQARQFKSKGFYVFDLFERGKLRTIRSVSFKERVVQRCLCDYALTPILSRTFIYDNSASLKGKGINFAIERMTTHLHRFYRAYGANGYILQYDFKVNAIPQTVGSTIVQAAKTECSVAVMVWRSLGGLLTGKYGLNELSGPVGTVDIIGDTVADAIAAEQWQAGLGSVLMLVVLLTVNVGVFNLLPVPALDGGRLLFLIWEGITRKPVPQKYEAIVHAVGLVLLLLLIVIVTFSDIFKLL